jgi:sulfur carrier protein
MKLKINGEPREVAANTVLGLLEELGLNPKATVVERNAQIVPAPAFPGTVLRDGDVLELVGIVGGG